MPNISNILHVDLPDILDKMSYIREDRREPTDRRSAWNSRDHISKAIKRGLTLKANEGLLSDNKENFLEQLDEIRFHATMEFEDLHAR